MKKLLLLATEKIDDSKFYLYALEMQYQKVIKIVKMETADNLKNNWRVGYLTEVERIMKWAIDDSLYITSKESLPTEYAHLTRFLLDKASYPDNLLYPISGTAEGIIRLCSLKILEKGKSVEFDVWGTDRRIIASISDPWWINYWDINYSKENHEKYEKFLSASKRKVFGMVERTQGSLNIKKLVVK